MGLRARLVPAGLSNPAAVAITGGTISGLTAYSQASGQMSLPAGTSTTPTLIFGSDTLGWYRNASNQWTLGGGGLSVITMTTNVVRQVNTGVYGWANSGSDSTGAYISAIGYGGQTNSVAYGAAAAAAGGAITRVEINKTVTAIADNTLTSVFTVTIPNAAHTATIEFECTGILGAGGAIGAHEGASTTKVQVLVTRTAGVNAVASAVSTVWGAVAANVAGANTVTTVAAVSAIAGAVGATNTFTLDLTINSNAGTSANHIALCYAKVLNANATGVTIA